jgi:hypothetical protein
MISVLRRGENQFKLHYNNTHDGIDAQPIFESEKNPGKRRGEHPSHCLSLVAHPSIVIRTPFTSSLLQLEPVLFIHST